MPRTTYPIHDDTNWGNVEERRSLESDASPAHVLRLAGSSTISAHAASCLRPAATFYAETSTFVSTKILPFAIVQLLTGRRYFPSEVEAAV
jgi:hypothetical protein